MTATTVQGIDSAPTRNARLLSWVREVAELTTPERVVWCDGSDEEWDRMTTALVDAGAFTRLTAKPNSFWAASDPVLHIYKAISNYAANRAARPTGYELKKYAGHTSRKSLASSTMIWSGLVIAFFVIVHVKQFKYGAWYETAGVNQIRDLARTEFEVFSQPLWVAFYFIATLVVALHLRHGISSSFQSLGLDHPVYTRRLTTWGIVFAVIIGGGLACIPVWVYLTR